MLITSEDRYLPTKL